MKHQLKLFCVGLLLSGFGGGATSPQARASGWAHSQETELEYFVGDWMDPEEVVHGLDAIPRSGSTKADLWPSDFWPYRTGGISYRYAYPDKFKTYSDTLKAYVQPKEWMDLVRGADAQKLRSETVRYSPAEKYDLTVGDIDFSFTRDQLNRGREIIRKNGSLPSWAGMCDGWAAASLMLPTPKKPVTVQLPTGDTLEWHPDDIGALGISLWTNGRFPHRSIGTTCREDPIRTHPNGRAVSKACFDVNPATFHLAIGNLVGRKSLSLILDKDANAEIWNYPVYKYEFTYFDPFDSSRVSPSWESVVVPYNVFFKWMDRFQDPLTRGIALEDGRRDDSGVHSVVGVNAKVSVVVPVKLHHGPQPAGKLLKHFSYTYDLELMHRGGRRIPVGGEWHSKEHPDFLWLPERSAFPFTKFHRFPTSYSSELPAGLWLTKVAKRASSMGIPLCGVVRELWRKSSGPEKVDDVFRCEELKPEGRVAPRVSEPLRSLFYDRW